MKGINQKQGQAVEPDMVEKKKPFIRTVLKGAGLLFLFLFITGMIGNFSTPARFTSSSSVYEGFDKVELEEGVYLGDVVGSLFTGNGQFRFLDGTTYSGEWQNSKINGEGSCIYPGTGHLPGKMEIPIRDNGWKMRCRRERIRLQTVLRIWEPFRKGRYWREPFCTRFLRKNRRYRN